MIEAGAVGVNLEDTVHGAGRTLHEIAAATERIHSARAAAQAAGVPIVINAEPMFTYSASGRKRRASIMR